MSEGKTCFVIAPIGEPDSETRKRSDQILVKQTIEDPLMICSDATNPNREVYYNLDILPAPLDRFYLKIMFSSANERKSGMA